MTLPLRRKRPITARNILRSIPCSTRFPLTWLQAASRTFAAGATCLLATQLCYSQQWQPTRVSPLSQAQPLPQDAHLQPHHSTTGRSTTGNSASLGTGRIVDQNSTEANQPAAASEQLGSGIVLRWRSSSSVQNNQNRPATQQFHSTQSQHASSNHANNPLRRTTAPATQTSDSGQRSVQPVSDIHPIDRFQQIQSAQYHRPGQQQLPAFPGDQPSAESIPTPNDLQSRQPEQTDPLDSVEAAPEPPVIRADNIQDPPSFPPQLGEDQSPADRPGPEGLDSNSTPPEPLPSLDNQPRFDRENDGLGDSYEEDLDSLMKRAREAAIPNCESQREQLQGHPLNTISLDISPKLGDGLRSLKNQSVDDQEKMAELAKLALNRDWTDYRGEHLTNGRLIDLRFGNVILDVNGQEQAVPVANLSDVDMNYVSELWNLPFKCGSGYEPLEGRQFVSSTVQWKASGACHNPLYFEQVQLERYGHETGPVLQPLISSAHFLLTIPMLPYKMAINPPHECQYALGYYRPGNCAPYMVQPFPWSARAALVQAGFWTGASALIP